MRKHTKDRPSSDSPCLDRRAFLSGAAAFGGLALATPSRGIAQPSLPLLRVANRIIEVDGKAAKVFQIRGPGGRSGLFATEGDRFQGTVLNDTGAPLQLHWHGQVRAANDQDRARPGGGMLAAGGLDSHDFPLTPGTHWMHSHTLSEQQLLAAPMVTREKDAGDVQDVVVMLHDFAFRSPEEIMAELGGSDVHSGHGAGHGTGRAGAGHGGHATGQHGSHHHGSGPQATGHGGGMHHGADHAGRHGAERNSGGGHGGHHGHATGMIHANDVRYDAYLANDRTLADPDIVRIEKGSRVRLRIINGATATSFHITTPGLATDIVAVDGVPCRPTRATSYPLAQGQRIDLLATIPREGGAFTALAQVEDALSRTGIVLATAGASVKRIESVAGAKAELLDLSLDSLLKPATPLPERKPDRVVPVMLGEAPGYRWTLNGRIHGEHEPIRVKQGERVEMSFMNPTSMMHPMHLHGHHFQVVAIGGRRLAGPVRDTVMVPPHQPVTVAFDAVHRGAWYLHCHHLYHMATGMMTEVVVM